MSLAERRAALREGNDVFVSGIDFRAKSAHILAIDRFWAIEDGYAQNAVAQLESLDIAECRKLNAEFMAAGEAVEKSEVKPYAVVGDVAVLAINGPMTKKMTSASYLFGGTSTEKTRSALKAALADASVSQILLHIESPGGQVSGTAELADDVREATAKKPVTAYVEDIGASAAYWVASQASALYVNKAGMVGSIGVFTTVTDSSEVAARMGYKVSLISTGKFKGAGQPGVKITDAQLEQWQKQVDATFSDFKEAVATGRGMGTDAVRSVADGRMFKSDEALTLGLVDGICSFEQCVAQVSGSAGIRQLGLTAPNPAGSAARPSKEPKMSVLTDIIARIKGTDPEAAAALSNLKPEDLPGAAATDEVAELKAFKARTEMAFLAQLATAHWDKLITADSDGRAYATWAEKDGIVETFKALALMDGGGKLQFSAKDGNFVVGPNLKRFMDANLSRTKNALQSQQIADADPRGGAPSGLDMKLIQGGLQRLVSGGRLRNSAVARAILEIKN